MVPLAGLFCFLNKFIIISPKKKKKHNINVNCKLFFILKLIYSIALDDFLYFETDSWIFYS